MIITGSLLRRMRQEAGMTQTHLAKIAGISQAHIAKIEGDKVDPRLSTVNKLLEILVGGKDKTCREIMTRGVLTIHPKDKIRKASENMVKNSISQLPVMADGIILGVITEEGIIRNLNPSVADEPVENVMETPFPSVSEETEVSAIRSLLKTHSGILVTRKNTVVGIITRSDLLKGVSNIKS